MGIYYLYTHFGFIKMNKFVYVLSNESMPGIYKIGKTINIQTRLKDLDSTQTPTPFNVELLFECQDHDYVEKKMHKIFNNVRVRTNREFFKVDLSSVKEVFNLFDGKIVEFENILNTKNKNCNQAPQIVITMEEYKQKQRIGIERAKAEGKYTGRAPLIEDKIFLIKKLLKDGQTKAEIARQLNISRKTIYNYLDRL
jgi:hypothetical protein